MFSFLCNLKGKSRKLAVSLFFSWLKPLCWMKHPGCLVFLAYGRSPAVSRPESARSRSFLSYLVSSLFFHFPTMVSLWSQYFNVVPSMFSQYTFKWITPHIAITANPTGEHFQSMYSVSNIRLSTYSSNTYKIYAK